MHLALALVDLRQLGTEQQRRGRVTEGVTVAKQWCTCHCQLSNGGGYTTRGVDPMEGMGHIWRAKSPAPDAPVRMLGCAKRLVRGERKWNKARHAPTLTGLLPACPSSPHPAPRFMRERAENAAKGQRNSVICPLANCVVLAGNQGGHNICDRSGGALARATIPQLDNTLPGVSADDDDLRHTDEFGIAELHAG